MSGSERPRRSTRIPAKTATTIVPQATPAKRKKRGDLQRLSYLLTNSKSTLTTVDISTVVNPENFLKLSHESQRELCSLLPPVAFSTYQPRVPVEHPSAQGSSGSHDTAEQAKPTPNHSPADLDHTFLENSFLLSAAHAFQDHLVTGWMTVTEDSQISTYQEGVYTGTMHAQWKDEEWQQSHKPSKRSKSNDLDLATLAQRDLLREGDIITYKRHFPFLSIEVEKELLVKSVNKQSGALSLLLPPGADRSLPSYLLPIAPPEPQPPIRLMEDIMSSIALEEGILDVDARISQDAREPIQLRPPELSNLQVDFAGVHVPSSRASKAAKSLTIWRWEEDRIPELEVQPHLDKGGREYVGTVFYLRRA